jgi:hypothetical protein
MAPKATEQLLDMEGRRRPLFWCQQQLCVVNQPPLNSGAASASPTSVDVLIRLRQGSHDLQQGFMLGMFFDNTSFLLCLLDTKVQRCLFRACFCCLRQLYVSSWEEHNFTLKLFKVWKKSASCVSLVAGT